ncbi:MAG: YitT family protein [Candidatus Cryptobacteroides sp.]|nr:YitT family protein [Bacteroidales bacterium]MDY2860688.1 YitT family protein [Candidatus Cryptobacteroides sp.]MCI7634120.1 YitT family protein [Bacteroidales bacterium]MDD7083494.1 YitT family protein [Bacteroidales bacterium]MDD7155024.1 YitT family protein [Bacteroidales bacterium]
MTAKSILKLGKEYLLLTLGILIYVAGWTIFMIPNNLIGGGLTGVSSIIQYAVGIKMGYTYFVLNAILLVTAFVVIGANFGGKTIYAIILASVGLNVLQDLIPAAIIETLSVQNGKLMSTIMGGILSGAGIGMSMSQGGSTGGTDIIALIVNKYRNISPGRIILWIDAVIILSSLAVPSYTAEGELVPFAEKITTVVYGLILITVNGYVIDLYLSGSKQSVQLFIMSRKYEEIADAITKDIHRGVTVLPAVGWYTKKENHVLMVVTRKTDLNFLLKYIKTIDNDAFLSVSSVSGVYGNGFDAIKSGRKMSPKVADSDKK